LRCSFAYCQFVFNFYNHQIVIDITGRSPEQSDIKCTWIPSPVWQNVFSLIVCLSIRRCPSEFINVEVWEHCTLWEIVGSGKVYYSSSIVIAGSLSTRESQ
jgi:hypothetical protein